MDRNDSAEKVGEAVEREKPQERMECQFPARNAGSRERLNYRGIAVDMGQPVT